MKDHTKNIIILLLFATVVGLILFGVGYVMGVSTIGNTVIKKGFQYLNENNITILGLNPNSAYDVHKVATLIKSFLLK
jgi:hypothetical protein